MKILSRYTFITLYFFLALSPVYAGELYVSGWLPYWREEKAIESTLQNITLLDEINPFIYTVKESGALHNNVKLTSGKWKDLRTKAEALDIAFIPTVMWAGRDAIYNTLKDETKRKAHIQSILQEVYRYDFDGIDIDYENKSAETRLYFSLFLKELREAMGYDREIICTIESRMPVEDRYSKGANIPTFIEYANDFSQINQYCDRVRVMAYDQGRADLTLNEERADPYVPVSDVAWVEKVMRVAAEEIDPRKLSIGVATYGYEYDMFPSGVGSEDMRYSRLWSFNPGYATSVAKTVGIEPVRNAAGELELVFPAQQSPEEIPLPNATRVLSWSDSGAVEDKVVLAQTLGIQGIAIFKIDGGEDQEMWNMLRKRKVGSSDVVTNPLPPVETVFVEATKPFVPEALLRVPEQNLEEGDVSEDVRTLQKLLNQAGYTVSESGPGSPGNETSIFGPATKRALIRYQEAHNLYPPIGFYGPLTRASMGKTALVTELARDLEMGDVGEDVRILQRILNREGFVVAPSGVGSPGQETNMFGAKTKEAVITYQRAMGISPSIGYVGPKTRASLLGR